ncbi:hypothetical protein ACFFX1_51650 [Dactylosporangium sucinum]|uniref:hypothetical protein n=1 Tax=Dactylosporangium sucinum TaxID=1424081 RepID=UPI00167C8B43|nr:hypothetical protein [Dactylosporangium sucinum]
MSIPRRAVLAGAAALAAGLASGCDIPTQRTAVWHPAPDVLLPLLQRTVELRDRYGEVLAAFPALQDRLGPLKDDHAQHVVALAREIGMPEEGPFPQPSASASALPTEQGAALTELINLERKGREDAEGACIAAPSYRAALLGSIAACRAGHVEVLT